MTLNFLLDRGSTNLIILKKNTLSQISLERTFFRTKRNTRLALLFRAYEDISGLTGAGIKMCYRLPGSDGGSTARALSVRPGLTRRKGATISPGPSLLGSSSKHTTLRA